MTENGELERLIDRAGRDQVFAAARALGWGSCDAVPVYVWRQIAAELIADPQWHPPSSIAPIFDYGLSFLGL